MFESIFSPDGKVSELESVRIGKCQNWKVSELEIVRIGKYHNWKVSDVKPLVLIHINIGESNYI